MPAVNAQIDKEDAEASKRASSVSAASVASVSSVASVASVASVSHSSATAALSSSESLAVASAKALTAAMTEDPAKDPFKSLKGTKTHIYTFGTQVITEVKRSDPAATTAANTIVTTGVIPTMPVAPAYTLPADQRRNEIPPGVPEYNLRMCQHDILLMQKNNQNLMFDLPGNSTSELQATNTY